MNVTFLLWNIPFLHYHPCVDSAIWWEKKNPMFGFPTGVRIQEICLIHCWTFFISWDTLTHITFQVFRPKSYDDWLWLYRRTPSTVEGRFNKHDVSGVVCTQGSRRSTTAILLDIACCLRCTIKKHDVSAVDEIPCIYISLKLYLP
jgi:hypothetical protein